MIDYGLKTPTRVKFVVPTACPRCMQCEIQLEHVRSDKARGLSVLWHPANVSPACSYAGRLFELEMDIRYLKEVTE